MGRSQPKRLAQALLLGAPLLAICAWLGILAVNHSQRPAAPTIETTIEPARRVELVPGFPPPDADLPAARLEERVDGAAESLRKNGCRRLVAWTLTSPPADLEVFVFDTVEGAKAWLDREAGSPRDPAPGDEASITDQAVLFRRGVFYAKLIADPTASGASAPLKAVAESLDRALSGTTGARLRGEQESSNP
jgi:hypothetical protein